MNEAQGLVASLLLLVAVFFYTFWPAGTAAESREKTRLDYLIERKEQLEENLRDLDFEFRAGKYPEGDFLAQKKVLDQETTELLAEIAQTEKA
jgi:hypothetical protein